ncbi:MAG: peptide ABC transporter substrate-binding protein [Culicoidibacterales bacterium]
MGKKSNKISRFILSMFGLSLVLASCVGSQGSISDTLRIATSVPSNSLNHLRTTELINSNIILNFMEGLLIPDLNGQLQPAAAESYTTSDDGLVHTFKLRDNNWSNGAKVTAADFVFAWRTEARDAKAGYKQYQAYLKNGKDVVAGVKPVEELGVRALDDKTLEVTLETPKTYFLELLSHMSLLPVNEAFYNAVGAESYGTSKETVLANGAYQLADYVGAAGYTLVKRADYWDAKNVEYNNVKVQVIKEMTTQTLLWDEGQLDEIYLSGDAIDKYKNDESLTFELDRTMYYMYISPHTATPEPAYGSKNLRAAVAHAIDKTILAESVFKDGSKGADFIIPYIITNKDGEEFRDFANQYNTPMFDKSKALELFEKAKIDLGKTQIEIPLTIDDAERNKKVFENIKGQLEQNLPGLKVNLTSIPAQTFFPTIFEYKTPGARHGWTSLQNDPVTFLDLFIAGSSYNFGKTELQEFTKKVKQSESPQNMLNQQERWKNIAEAEKLLVEEYYNIPLVQRGSKKLVTKGITGLSFNNNGPQNISYRFVKMVK